MPGQDIASIGYAYSNQFILVSGLISGFINSIFPLSFLPGISGNSTIALFHVYGVKLGK
jgi:hypothetical protein